MTGHTVSDVKNIFISMFFNHLILLMTGCAGIDGCIIAWMTRAAYAIGILMVEWEGVSKGCISEI